jgi:hypothetical protein
MNLNSMEKPPPVSRHASEQPSAGGSLSIKCAIEVDHLMPESGCNASLKN